MTPIEHFAQLQAEFEGLGFTVVRPSDDELLAYRNGTQKRAVAHLYHHAPFFIYDLVSLVLPLHEPFDIEAEFATNHTRAAYVSSQGGFIPNDVLNKMLMGNDQMVRDTKGWPERVALALEARDR